MNQNFHELRNSCPSDTDLIADDVQGSLLENPNIPSGDKKLHICEICQISFCEKCDLNEHLHIHNQDQNIDLKLLSSSLVMNSSTELSPFVINAPQTLILSALPMWPSLEQSRAPKIHGNCSQPSGGSAQNGGNKYVCDVCCKEFTTRTRLNEHLEIHAGAIYVCNICQKSYSQKSTLRRHQRFHTGKNLLVCEICKKSFCRKYELNKHILTHTREKSHICEICQKLFVSKMSLRQHLSSIHTREIQHVCEICHKSFNRKDKLKEHRLVHTGEKPYVCDICQEGFVFRVSLNKHYHKHEGKM